MADIGSFGSMGDAKNPWIGTIPAGWGVGRAGFYYDIQLGKMLCSTPSSNAYTLEKYFCAANVHYEDADSRGLKEMWFSPSEKPAYEVSEGDMLVVEGGAGAGGCAIVKKLDAPAYMQNSILRVRGRGGASNVYFCYWLEYLGRSGYIDIACNKATIPHFTKEKLSAVPLPLPPVAEQQRIVSFLDRECEKIDALKAKIETQIAKLEELRKCTISEVVTKGLDRRVKFKPSGVEWIGDIPESWSVMKSSYAYEGVYDIDHYMPRSVDVGVPYLMTGDLKDKLSGVDFDSCKKISVEDFKKLSSKIRVSRGDVIFARYATIGTVCRVDVDADFVVSYSCVTIRPGESLDGGYLYYYLKSSSYENEIRQYMNVGTQGNVGIASILAAKIVLPPRTVQEEIARYLDRKCQSIDASIECCKMQLDKLSEYRKSLIYEYVTGKKEVA